MTFRTLTAAALALTFNACAGPAADRPGVGPPVPVAVATDDAPRRPAGAPALASTATLTRIAIGSCAEETEAIGPFAAIVAARPDLFVYAGDNLYGDDKTGDPGLPVLTEAYRALARNADFGALTAAVPMLAVWDDHDYGLNDAGGDWPGKRRSERLFETFYGDAAVGTDVEGVYGSRVYGPPGRRVQVILLDTRFFRSPLTTIAQPDPARRGRYVPDPAATLLGDAQWRWLEAELRRPAEVRLIVSSIQVLADGHFFEAWNLMPSEQARLYATVRRTGAKGVVLASGDRHVAALYKQAGRVDYPLYELTASSLNKAFVKTGDEVSTGQIGPVYTPENFGLVEIDWDARRLALSVRDAAGAPVRQVAVPFAEIGL